MLASSLDLTRMLAEWRDGDEQALEELLPEVYGELRRLASSYLRREQSGFTLETHDLIHEAFLRLLDARQIDWQNRGHFFAVVARLMRRVLVEHARRRTTGKRGGDAEKVVLDEMPDLSLERSRELLALDQALDELAATLPEISQVVEQRYFGGMTHEEIAELLGQSKTTVRRRWRRAKAWLYLRLGEEHSLGS